MRNGSIGLVSAMVLGSTMAAAACADSSNGGTGGTASTTGGSSSSGGNATSSGGNATSSGGKATSSGGQQSTGGSVTGGSGPGTGGSSSTGGSCSSGTPCGGSLVGTWTVTSSCLTVSGELDLSIIGIDCTRGQITSGALQVSGTFTANSDTTFSDNTTTTGNVDFTLVEQCRHWSGTLVVCDALGRSAFPSIGFQQYPATSCQDAASGGGCTCHGGVAQSGGMGVVSVTPLTSGNYTTSGSALTITDGFYNTSYSYCVSGNTLTLTPQTTLPITTGTIVLQKQ